MAYLNSVQLIGNVGSDPEVKTFDHGKLATFRVATTERYRDRNNHQQEVTQWHSCSASGSIADVVEKYVRKGMQVFIGGKLTYRSYDGKDGTTRWATDIRVYTVQMLDKKQKDAPVVDDLPDNDLPDFLR